MNMNKFALDARLMSHRESLDRDVVKCLLECSDEIERLQAELNRIEADKAIRDFTESLLKNSEFPKAATNHYSDILKCDKCSGEVEYDVSIQLTSIPPRYSGKCKECGEVKSNVCTEVVNAVAWNGQRNSAMEFRMMPPIDISVPIATMRNAILNADDHFNISSFAKNFYGIVQAEGKPIDKFKQRIIAHMKSHQQIVEGENEDLVCAHCDRPLNCDKHCINFACPGKA